MFLKLLEIIVRVISGYYIFYLVVLALIKVFKPNNKTRIYIKETFHLNQEKLKKVRLLSQFVFTTLSIAALIFIVMSNYAPLGLVFNYSLNAEGKEGKFNIHGNSVYYK